MRDTAVRSEKIFVSEAARILGISAGCVRILIDSNQLAAERGPMNIRLIDRRAVEKLAEDRPKKVEATARSSR